MNSEEALQKSKIMGRSCLAIILTALFFVLSPIILFLGHLFYQKNFNIIKLLESTSPNGSYTLTIEQKGETSITGPETIQITSSSGDSITVEIPNRGETLESSNVTIIWYDDESAAITFNTKVGLHPKDRQETIYFYAPNTFIQEH